jgi:eukaryotic-like serine/threonine-protein kinase
MDTQRNLLAALLAIQNKWVCQEDVDTLFPRWQADPHGDFLDWLAQQGKVARADLTLAESLLQQKLEQHHGDAKAGLDSVMASGDWQALIPSQIATLGGDTAEMVRSPAGKPGVPLQPAETPSLKSGNPSRRYVRLHLHAAGGIGQVFLARDTHLDREVALKELKPAASQDPSMSWRFLKEAHITGQLEHPGIVPVYELVTEEAGRVPYYVMRFLRGKTLSQAIKEYHQKRATQEATLERAALLNAFIAVCQTVAFAHSRGIVHRDLKGANILLGDFGEVAVLDWGLAKKVGDAETNWKEGAKGSATIDLDQSAEFERTLEGQVLGTPFYMSPEQATGKPVNVRSDVYSLGAILYEILTGQPPFARPGHKEASLRELLRRVSAEKPIPPRQLAADVPPALAAVCLRALEKEPDKRYGGAVELGQDVQRWLADEPVSAYPEPLMARIGRWTRRNRILVTSAGALLTATVLGLAIFTVLLNQEQRRTEKARARAEANFKKAQDAVDQYLTKVSEERLLNEPGLQNLRRELLATALSFYADFTRDQGNDPASRLALGDAQLKLAQIHSKLGERTEAVRILEQARELFRDLLTKNPNSTDYRYNLAQCHLLLATQVLRLKGPGSEAEELAEQARTGYADVVQRQPLPQYRSDLADAHNSLAQILVNRRSATIGPEADQLRIRALAEQQAAVEIWQKLVDEQPENPQWSKLLAAGLGNLAPLFDPVLETDKRGQSLTRAVRLLEGLVERDSKNIDHQILLGGAYRNLGVHHRLLGERAEAEDNLRRAVDLRYKLARKNPNLPDLHFRAADDYYQLANFLFEQGFDKEGEAGKKLLAQSQEAYQKCIAICQRLADDYPEEKRYLAFWGQSLNSMGDAVFQQSITQAIAWYDQGIEKLESALKDGEKSADYLRSLANAYEARGLFRGKQGRLPLARDDLDRAAELAVGDKRNELIRKRRQMVIELSMKNNDFETAAKEIAQVTAEPLTPSEKYRSARLLAICSAMANDAKSPLAEKYAAEVMVLLNEAKNGGVFNNAENIRGVEELERLGEPLSKRPDFQELLRELKKK